MEYNTKNYCIRRFKPRDFKMWRQGYADRLPSQNDFDLGFVPLKDNIYYYDYISHLAREERKDNLFVMGIFDRDNTICYGIVEFIIHMRLGVDWGSYGISVHNQHWGKGIGTEVVEGSLFIAKFMLALRRLECIIEEGNTRSERLFSKFDFQFEVTRNDFIPKDDTFINANIYSKIL